MKKTKWIGTPSEFCEICSRPIKHQFVDGKTMSGPWAIMCVSCHAACGFGLGVGRGQMYEKERDGSWTKVGR